MCKDDVFDNDCFVKLARIIGLRIVQIIGRGFNRPILKTEVNKSKIEFLSYNFANKIENKDVEYVCLRYKTCKYSLGLTIAFKEKPSKS